MIRCVNVSGADACRERQAGHRVVMAEQNQQQNQQRNQQQNLQLPLLYAFSLFTVLPCRIMFKQHCTGL